MPRFARIVVPQCAHHVTQRGNDRRDVFFTPVDRHTYLNLLKHYAQQLAVDVLGYCLMTNHVHIVLFPTEQGSLSKLMRVLQMRYAQYRHALDQSSGHLWQCRYYSCPVAWEQLPAVMSYVELNPVRAGMVEDARAYPWSSAKAHLSGVDSRGVLRLTEWRLDWTPLEWAAMLKAGRDELASIREATYAGRPLGSEEFVSRLETHLGRRLRPGVNGRPKKTMAVGKS